MFCFFKKKVNKPLENLFSQLEQNRKKRQASMKKIKDMYAMKRTPLSPPKQRGV